MAVEPLKPEPLAMGQASIPLPGRIPKLETASDDEPSSTEPEGREVDGPDALLSGGPPRALRRGSRIRRGESRVRVCCCSRQCLEEC
jgi:hypothetical protein